MLWCLRFGGCCILFVCVHCLCFDLISFSAYVILLSASPRLSFCVADLFCFGFCDYFGSLPVFACLFALLLWLFVSGLVLLFVCYLLCYLVCFVC